MYSLKQATHLIYNNLVQYLKPYGSSPHHLSKNIWIHNIQKKSVYAWMIFGFSGSLIDDLSYSIASFIAKNEIIKKLFHSLSKLHQYVQHARTVPLNRKNYHFNKPPESSPPLSAQQTSNDQHVIGIFIYFSRAVNNTILTALNDISM